MDQNKEILANLRQIKANFNKLDEKFKKIKADSLTPGVSYDDSGVLDMQCSIDCMQNEVDYVYLSLNNLRNYVYQLEGSFYNWTYDHITNHVPKLNASAMEKFLKTVGLQDDFEISKPTIYMTATKNGPVINVSYKK